MKRSALEQDEILRISIDGSDQRLRICAARRGLPPLLIVQAGPGLPLLNEVDRFRASLALEDEYTVAYWDQRGCGKASRKAAGSLSLDRLLEDLCRVIRRLHAMTGAKVALLGISIGGSLAMRAAAREEAIVSIVFAVSPDLNVAMGDDNARGVLAESSKGDARTSRALARLGPPPYLTPSRFQRRLKLLADYGAVERGRKFGPMLSALALSLVKSYGLFGAGKALRNARLIQARLLPELAGLDLLSSWPESAVPFRLFFGEEDILSPPSLVEAASRRLKSGDSLVVLPRAGHMVHFDRPDALKEHLRPMA